jgi:hypothetical protein
MQVLSLMELNGGFEVVRFKNTYQSLKILESFDLVKSLLINKIILNILWPLSFVNDIIATRLIKHTHRWNYQRTPGCLTQEFAQIHHGQVLLEIQI